MKLGHVLAADGNLELLKNRDFIYFFLNFVDSRKNSFQTLIKKMPESELSANRMGWNAAHFAAKVLFYLLTQLTY